MEYAVIFTEMSWISALIIIVGLVLLTIEVFVPGFGFFGIAGLVTMGAGIVVRIFEGLDFLQAIWFVLTIVAGLLIMSFVVLVGGRRLVLGRTGIFENSTTISTHYNQVDRELKKLVGKTGKTVSKLDLAGKAKIKGKIYDVMSINSYIESGAHIKVVAIKNNTILVRKWFE